MSSPGSQGGLDFVPTRVLERIRGFGQPRAQVSVPNTPVNRTAICNTPFSRRPRATPLRWTPDPGLSMQVDTLTSQIDDLRSQLVQQSEAHADESTELARRISELEEANSALRAQAVQPAPPPRAPLPAGTAGIYQSPPNAYPRQALPPQGQGGPPPPPPRERQRMGDPSQKGEHVSSPTPGYYGEARRPLALKRASRSPAMPAAVVEREAERERQRGAAGERERESVYNSNEEEMYREKERARVGERLGVVGGRRPPPSFSVSLSGLLPQGERERDMGGHAGYSLSPPVSPPIVSGGQGYGETGSPAQHQSIRLNVGQAPPIGRERQRGRERVGHPQSGRDAEGTKFRTTRVGYGRSVSREGGSVGLDRQRERERDRAPIHMGVDASQYQTRGPSASVDGGQGQRGGAAIRVSEVRTQGRQDMITITSSTDPDSVRRRLARGSVRPTSRPGSARPPRASQSRVSVPRHVQGQREPSMVVSLASHGRERERDTRPREGGSIRGVRVLGGNDNLSPQGGGDARRERKGLKSAWR
ncbi:hypothetical protein KIPB_001920 [Kipferlia bialata]|uniref:Uncharacterized protein n=1 Tax=Kipferlia bialata TaxID=797122 RepID=A0A9K3GFQ6_9EUKA|nr:hypothetical protein KIPB_001920 [Kipferlia bialata]|eukprot:g1920.t1